MLYGLMSLPLSDSYLPSADFEMPTSAESCSNVSFCAVRKSFKRSPIVSLTCMSKPQFAILRFAKYKGPEISNIEAHNERTKEKYASNPDIDKSRSHLNFHLLEPERKYRAEAERQIKDAGCRTRSDSVSNLSAKLQRESIRYKEVVELADALGYDLIWQKRREK